MLQWLLEIDKALFNAINGSFSACDTLMWGVSILWIWIPLYVFFMFCLWQKYGSRNERGRRKGNRRAIVMISVVVCVALCDVISARVLKPSVARLRPSHSCEFVGNIHLHEYDDGTFYKGGQYSFLSGHASNHMAVAVLVGLLMESGIWMTLLMGWALLIGYSRVHLGVHFPSDVICGWMLGGGLGWMIYMIILRKL